MPTATPATITWSVGAASSDEPEPRYLVGGVALPTTTATTGADLLATADPWLAAALPYYQHCLNRALASQVRPALAGQSLNADTTKAACIETLPVDPGETILSARALRLPLLAIYPVSATFAERTMHRERMLATYRLDYILPGLSHEQSTRIQPILQAAAGVILLATRAGSSASYQSGEPVWPPTLVEYTHCVSATFGAYERADTAHRLPALSMTLEVALVSFDDDGAGLPFWGADLTLSLTDATGDEYTLVEAQTDIP